ncbi:MAG: sulfite exporter TauE/SafE family protein [Moraxellaceae bacterium]
MLLTLAVGVLIGLVLGLTGAGGSVLALPLLILLLKSEPAMAAGWSLGAVALAAIAGVVMRLGKGQVVWAAAVVLGVAGAVFTPLGQAVAQWLPANFLRFLFVGMVLLIALRMWRQARQMPEDTRILRASLSAAEAPAALACQLSRSGRFEWRWPCVLRMVGVGAATGVLAGLFGVGGGFVIVPALVLLMGLTMVQAVATSLAVIAMVSASGFASFISQQAGWPQAMVPLLAGSLGGMLVGTVLAPRLAGPGLQRFFVIVMVLMAAMMLLRAS